MNRNTHTHTTRKNLDYRFCFQIDPFLVEIVVLNNYQKSQTCSTVTVRVSPQHQRTLIRLKWIIQYLYKKWVLSYWRHSLGLSGLFILFKSPPEWSKIANQLVQLVSVTAYWVQNVNQTRYIRLGEKHFIGFIMSLCVWLWCIVERSVYLILVCCGFCRRNQNLRIARIVLF